MANKKRLIDAFSLTIRFSKKNAKRPLQYDDVLAIIADEKTVDAVEVVRCKDCKFAVVQPFMADSQKLVCTNAVNWRAVEPGHFCSYGERRDNAV